MGVSITRTPSYTPSADTPYSPSPQSASHPSASPTDRTRRRSEWRRPSVQLSKHSSAELCPWRSWRPPPKIRAVSLAWRERLLSSERAAWRTSTSARHPCPCSNRSGRWAIFPPACHQSQVLRMSTSLSQHHTPTSVTVHPPTNTHLCHYIPINIHMYHYIPVDTPLCHYIPINIHMYHYIPVNMDMYHYIPVNTPLCDYITINMHIYH